MKSWKKITLITGLFLIGSQALKAQFLMDMVDTTKDMGKGLLSIYQKYNGLRLSGYLQPQFQYVQEKGAETFYAGGVFAPNSNNRFMIRRGRVRFEYVRFNDNSQPVMQFVFQIDGTERGIGIRDVWGRYFENKWSLFSFTGGMFARPFGYEVNLSSLDRESPERGRMSQILMKSERDLGVMASFEPRTKTNFLKYVKVDAGFFNGQGLTNVGDFDSYKDFIARAAIKPYRLNKSFSISGGLSYFNGGFLQNSRYVNKMGKENGHPVFITDSLESNFDAKAPRKYYGADIQVKWKHLKSTTEFRAEYWQGMQTATSLTSETPPILLQPGDVYYRRNFNGAFFYLLHTINKQHQFVVKYDWYDPNTKIKGKDIGAPGSATHPADIKYSTLGVGYNYYINENMKLVLWYDFVRNESTSLPGYTQDVKDNVLTCRVQFRF